jgi:hypothetical protein
MPLGVGVWLLAGLNDLRILAGGDQEVGEERAAVVIGVKPRDAFALRFEEHVFGLENRGLAMNGSLGPT